MDVQTGLPVPDTRCSNIGLTRPAQQEVCVINACEQGPRFTPTEWSTCSVTCGGGVRVREVECRNAGLTVLPYEDCVAEYSELGLPIPEAEQPCNTHACETLAVEYTEFQPCEPGYSDSCESITREAYPICRGDRGSVLPPGECGATKLVEHCAADNGTCLPAWYTVGSDHYEGN